MTCGRSPARNRCRCCVRRPDLAAGPADRIAAALRRPAPGGRTGGGVPRRHGLSSDAFLALLPADRRTPDPRSRVVWTAMLDRSAADDPQALALLTLAAWLGPAAGAAVPADRELGRAARAARGPRPGCRPGSRSRRAAAPPRAGPGHGRRLRCTRCRPGCWSPAPATTTPAKAGGRPSPSGCCGPPHPTARRPTPRPGRPGGGCCRTCSPRPTRPGGSTPSRPRSAGCCARRAEYLQARGRTHAARALLDDARGFDSGGRRQGPSDPRMS